MTKKDYVMTANVLRKHYWISKKDLDINALANIQKIVGDLCVVFKKDNILFDPHFFAKAIFDE